MSLELDIQNIDLSQATQMHERGFYSDRANLRIANLLTKSECNELAKLVIEAPYSNCLMGDANAPYRKADIRFIPARELGDSYPDILQKLCSALTLGGTHFGYKLEFLPQSGIQLSNYPPGGVYDWHVDSTKRDHHMRLITLVIELSEPDGYEGGGIQSRLYEDSTEFINDRLQQGEAILFPSNRPHRARKVISGFRQSLACWAAGEINPCQPFWSAS